MDPMDPNPEILRISLALLFLMSGGSMGAEGGSGRWISSFFWVSRGPSGDLPYEVGVPTDTKILS